MFYKVQLVGGSFQDSSGNPLSQGYLEFRLSHDSNIGILGGPTGQQVVAGIPVNIYLDGLGNCISNQYIWPNDQLTPSGSYYTVNAYNNIGLKVWAVPQLFTITSETPTLGTNINVGTLVPLYPFATSPEVG